MRPPANTGTEALAMAYPALEIVGVYTTSTTGLLLFSFMSTFALLNHRYEAESFASGSWLLSASFNAAVASSILAWLFFSCLLFLMPRSIASFNVIGLFPVQ
jgi:hypothetical protein